MMDRYINDARRKNNRIGEICVNNEGCMMQIVEYVNANNIIVEFLDNAQYKAKTSYRSFKNGIVKNWGKHLYEENTNNFGLCMKIVYYGRSDDIVVEFDDGEKVHTTYTNFKKGNVRHPNKNFLQQQHDGRINETRQNLQGDQMRIIEYDNRNHIRIQFLDEHRYEMDTLYKTFLSGSIVNPYHSTVFDIGVVGTKYPIAINDVATKEYSTWVEMLKRCYSEQIRQNRPTYIECTVSPIWHSYENFYDWLHEQENFSIWVSLDRSALDKDILFKHNKKYSPETCCLVPHYINALFNRQDSCRGEYPIGVSYHKATNKYIAQCGVGEGKAYLGVYDTPHQAFLVYKQYKEKYIKQLANKCYQNGEISNRCYEAMMKYEVEEDD